MIIVVIKLCKRSTLTGWNQSHLVHFLCCRSAPLRGRKRNSRALSPCACVCICVCEGVVRRYPCFFLIPPSLMHTTPPLPVHLFNNKIQLQPEPVLPTDKDPYCRCSLRQMHPVFTSLSELPVIPPSIQDFRCAELFLPAAGQRARVRAGAKRGPVGPVGLS